MSKKKNTIIILVAISTIIAVVVLLYEKDKIIDTTPKAIRIYSSMPIDTGIGAAVSRAAKMAINEANAADPKHPIEFVIGDDTLGDGWSEQKMRANIRTAIADPNTVAFYGTIHSTAAKIAIPMLNLAGVPMISPTNSWPGLTKPGFASDEPGRFYPAKARTYVRISPTDELETINAAQWSKALGYKHVALVDDLSLDYGTTLLYEQNMRGLGVAVDRIVLDKSSPETAALEIKRMRPDLIYYNGLAGESFSGFIRAMGPNIHNYGLMGSDSLFDNLDMATVASSIEGAYFTSVNIPIQQLKNPLAETFIESYRREYDKSPDIYSAMGYEAMRILIHAIRASDGTREGVRAKLFETNAFPTIFGPVTIDAQGDNVFGITAQLRVKNGKLEYLGTLGKKNTLLSH